MPVRRRNMRKRKPKKQNRVKEKKERKVKAAKPVKDKSETYIIKKNSTMKVLRFVFWGMLTFVFLKGVIVSIKPDPTIEVNNTISQFVQEFTNYKDQDNEILSFAQNFAREFLTYDAKAESDFLDRLRPYASGNILNTTFNFQNSARALYVQAYKKELYSENQFDVYVLASVQYISKTTSEDKATFSELMTTRQAILKVPIQKKNSQYIVEDIPSFVNDDIKISDYSPVEYYGAEVNDSEKSAIKQSLTNFYKSYYEDEQSVINYYLTKDADKTVFRGLNKRVKFNKIDNIRCYNIEGRKEILVIVVVSILDSNNVLIPQKYNLKVIWQDGKYYIQDMNTRSVNVNIN